MGSEIFQQANKGISLPEGVTDYFFKMRLLFLFFFSSQLENIQCDK